MIESHSARFERAPPAGSSHKGHFVLDPEVAYLNHGSFGACPRPVLAAQGAIRDRLEREPVQFFAHDLVRLADSARARLAEVIGADSDDLAFVPNATTGVNTVLFQLPLLENDEILTTDHVYPACKNALFAHAARAKARVIVAPVPFPPRSDDDVLGPIWERVTEKTKLLLIDHVTSPTGLIFPIADLVKKLRERGIETLVDGAHAPGMIPLHLDALGAAYYTGNCHKWLCTPKGSAFLHVRRDLQAGFSPLIISHGATLPVGARSRFRLDFDWVGTDDPSPFLAIPSAIDFLSSIFPGGLSTLCAHNRQLALAARKLLANPGDALAPEGMIGSLAAVPFRPSPSKVSPKGMVDPARDELFARFGIEVMVAGWPQRPARLLRISAQIYNRLEEYQHLAQVLPELRS